MPRAMKSIATLLLLCCLVATRAAAGWSGVCLDAEQAHAFAPSALIGSCHGMAGLPGKAAGQTCCGPAEGCLDLFSSPEANLPRASVTPPLPKAFPIRLAGHPAAPAPFAKNAFGSLSLPALPNPPLEHKRLVVLLM